MPKGFCELQARKKDAEDFAAAIAAGAFIAAGKFAEEMDEADERFYLLAAHELLLAFIIQCGGQYCRHLGQNIPETNHVVAWVNNAVKKINEFADGDEKEAAFIRAALLEQLIQQGNTRVKAEYVAIPAMDKSAIPEPKRKAVRAA